MSQAITPNYEEFANWVRETLKHLYDSAYLQTHPLAHWVGDKTGDAHHRSQELRRLLIEAIQALYPSRPVSANSPDWRTYKVLELRYVQGKSWAEVMDELALGKTLYYEIHALALEAVTQALWDGLQQKLGKVAAPLGSEPTSRAEEAQLSVTHMLAQANWEAIPIPPLLDELRTLITPLTEAKGTSLSFDVSHPITVLHADRVILRQTLLNVMTYAVDVGARGQIAVASFAEGGEAGIRIHTWQESAKASPVMVRPRQGLGLDICEQLIREMGGAMYLHIKGENDWQARLAWATCVNLKLLVVDDNQGLVDLMRRYLAGTNWEITGASDGMQARQLIAQKRPGVIILDVLMPGEDGWELLMNFKAQAHTKDIPIVICSVFNEPQLARNLGAAAYLPKPVTQRALLGILKPWAQVGATLAPAH